MSVPGVRAKLLNAQIRIPDAQIYIRNVCSELLHIQASLPDSSQTSLPSDLDEKLKNLGETLHTTRKDIGECEDQGVRGELKGAFTKLLQIERRRRLSPNAQAISDALTNMEEVKMQFNGAYEDIEKAGKKLDDVRERKQPIRDLSNIGEAEILLQAVQAHIREAKSNLQTALKLIQIIPTAGQITVGLLLGIVLAAFGWYELFLRRPTSLFDGIQFIILCIIFLAICGSAVYLAEAVPLAQESKQKYVIWLCCIILFVLIGFALFYGALHQLGYQDKNLPPFPELVAFTSLIVIAPLIIFVISGGYKGISSNSQYQKNNRIW